MIDDGRASSFAPSGVASAIVPKSSLSDEARSSARRASMKMGLMFSLFSRRRRMRSAFNFACRGREIA